METYQPIYDAVRSRISGFDSSSLIDSIDYQFDISQQVEAVKNEFLDVAFEYQRPSVLFRPQLSIDGNQWCVLYGSDLQSGIAGFGETPSKAMLDFDKNWCNTYINEGYYENNQ